MSYSASTDIVPNRLSPTDVIRLCTDDTSVTDPTDPAVQAVITEAIADADSIIETYCSKRYEMPFSPVPASVKKASADMATYYLFRRRPFSNDAAAKIWKDAHDAAVAWLKDISVGKAAIEGAVVPIQNQNEQNSYFTSNDRRFTRDTLKGF